MPGTFTIDTAQQTLKADDKGQASIVFTVTNTAARPMRGIAQIKPLDNTQAKWLKIDGSEVEHDFSAGGTHQFTVNFEKTPPPNTSQPAESFPFRLEVYSSTKP